MFEVWHDRYTLPSLWDFYTPSRSDHGAYFYHWTTWDEVEWRNFYRVWMEFLNDYKNLGGRVTVGSDAGFIFSTPGFGTVTELELLQEAGFHPLEAIRAATLHGAETLFKPTGRPIEFGVVREGMLADLVISPENPVENLEVLYGTGWIRLNDQTRAGELGGRRRLHHQGRHRVRRQEAPGRRLRDGGEAEAGAGDGGGGVARAVTALPGAAGVVLVALAWTVYCERPNTSLATPSAVTALGQPA
jgi:hypothetical protein